MPPEIRTRATLRSAEFGFFGVVVYTRVHTPRRCGAATFFLRPLPDLRPGVDSFLDFGVRPLRTSWLVVGMRRVMVAKSGRSPRPGGELPRSGAGPSVARGPDEQGEGADATAPNVGRDCRRGPVAEDRLRRQHPLTALELRAGVQLRDPRGAHSDAQALPGPPDMGAHDGGLEAAVAAEVGDPAEAREQRLELQSRPAGTALAARGPHAGRGAERCAS